MQNSLDEGHFGWCLLSELLLIMRGPPSWIQQLCKVNESQSLRANSSSGEVEDNRSFHGREERVTRTGGGIVEEVCLIYSAIFTFGGGFANYPSKRVRGYSQKFVWYSITFLPYPFLKEGWDWVMLIVEDTTTHL